MAAFLRRTPGLEPLVHRSSALLGTTHKSTLSYCLRRPTTLGLVQALLTDLQQRLYRPASGDLVALDSMPLTLTATRRHGCRRLNPQTAGGGVLWELWLDAPAGACPVRILRLLGGAWHDTQSVADAPLLARGPIYLMDIGFWAIHHVRDWLARAIHFILRVNPQDLCFTLDQVLSPPRTLAGGLELRCDGLATLGGPQRKLKPQVRLVWARFQREGQWEELILVSDQFNWSAERLLGAYKRRGEIEQFHRVLKETVGLAHLYSFQELGVMLMLHVAVLLAVLLLLGSPPKAGPLPERLRAALAQARQGLVMEPGLWRRNMLAKHQGRGSRCRRKKGGGRSVYHREQNH